MREFPFISFFCPNECGTCLFLLSKSNLASPQWRNRWRLKSLGYLIRNLYCRVQLWPQHSSRHSNGWHCQTLYSQDIQSLFPRIRGISKTRWNCEVWRFSCTATSSTCYHQPLSLNWKNFYFQRFISTRPICWYYSVKHYCQRELWFHYRDQPI
jgi:hypothetical protein